MKKNKMKSFLLNTPTYKAEDGRPKLLRIILSSENVKVDFAYQTNDYYFKGGWVRISPETFIRFQEEGEKYKLLEAINIPLAPKYLHFNTTKDWLYFSLIFEPMPIKKAKFDLIELENSAKSDFNYFDIFLDEKKIITIL